MAELGDFIEDEDRALADTPEMRRYLKQIASGHAADFRRGFARVDLVRDLVARGEPHWFLDLLSLWRPSGEPSGADGLRLAVRNEYLNFYRLGQSVARVHVVNGQLKGKVHVKYFSERARSEKLQAYGAFEGERVRGAGHDEPYRGLSTLREWAATIKASYSGTEKELVDRLVEHNSNVIDLEMALPAWRAKRNAPRMDLVTIEDQQVVFWEAKTVSDSRIRCNPGRLPEVLKQLAEYRAFLEQDIHVERVEAAYRNAAEVIVALRELADQLGPVRPLGPEIVAASRSPGLRVASEAVLIVLDDAPPSGATWRSWHDNGHAAKLRGHARALVQSLPGRLALGDAA